MIKYIFDIDGTLTPSRQPMSQDFKTWFEHFATRNAVYFVTGSDRDKTIEQIGLPLYSLAMCVYNCSGNDIWQQSKNIYRNEWKPSKELLEFFDGWLQSSKFELRTGNHIEERPGCVNFSIVGRNASYEDRKLYIKYDTNNRERETIAHIINSEFDNITATIGGETGIDIAPTGCDKSQILNYFSDSDIIYFFGDKTEQGGNDYPLARKLKFPNQVYQVKDWKDTWEKLKRISGE